MQRLGLLFFSMRLILSLKWFIFVFSLDYILQKLWKYRVTLASLLLISVVALSWIAQQNTLVQPTPIETQVTTSVMQYPFLETNNYTQSEIRENISELSSANEIQPQNRDILINIALLYDAIGEEENALPYWEKARKIDPNHPVFSN
ncbi:MAG: hypothetical protein WAU07_01865 [Microgenomates group bacterium]